MRPMRSATPPITTMKIPENRAVMATAMFMVSAVTPRSRLMSGAMFRVVWANSQKAMTPMMMPKRSLSLPWYLAVLATVDIVNPLRYVRWRDSIVLLNRVLMNLSILQKIYADDLG